MINPQKEILGWSLCLSHSDLSPGREFCPPLAPPLLGGAFSPAFAFPLTLIELHLVVLEKTTGAVLLFWP